MSAASDAGRQAAQKRAALVASGRGWFITQLPGTCEQCGRRWRPGAAVRLEIPRAWRGECCADGAS